MLKKELLDTFRSTRAKIVFFVFLAIMVYDFVDKYTGSTKTIGFIGSVS